MYVEKDSPARSRFSLFENDDTRGFPFENDDNSVLGDVLDELDGVLDDDDDDKRCVQVFRA